MNQEAQEVFDRIVALDLHELTDDDKAFLRARASYLSKEQSEKFTSVLKPVIELEDEETPKKKK
jgi:hypothetical protein